MGINFLSSTLLGNISIGEHSKIGACSVVLKNVLPKTTVAGVPAKVINNNNENMPAHQMEHNFYT